MQRAFLICLVFLCNQALPQNMVTLTGVVRNEKSEALSNVNIRIEPSGKTIRTDVQGRYLASLKAESLFFLTFSSTGYRTYKVQLKTPSDFSTQVLNVVLKVFINELDSVSINTKINNPAYLDIEGTSVENAPMASGNFESFLKTLPGVSTNNEMSAQYSVRGGNFDENMVYINDIEIFRPLLVRSGQQEGLSFINPELVSKASFSAGGFEARYGDKMSSVLDVKYSRPDSNQLNVSAGLLGMSAAAKFKSDRSFVLLGLRRKINHNILKTQQIEGSYDPLFYDFQALYNIQLNKKLSLSAFGNYNLSRFGLVPESRKTVFGTINQQYNLDIAYQGKEDDRFESLSGGVTFSYNPDPNISLKWISSVFKNKEEERFDILGAYIFQEMRPVEGSETAPINRGIGIDYNYGRNTLKSAVYSSELRGYFQTYKYSWEAGFRYQLDEIDDSLNEYNLIDSAGYSLPYVPGSFSIPDAVYASNNISRNRLTAYLQNTARLRPKITLTSGIRAGFNSFNKQYTLSPRASATITQNDDNLWRISAGVYHQPAFYREARRFDGSVNPQGKAQRAIHFLLVNERWLKARATSLNLKSEIYYKKLDNLIPYKVDNLRIRYFADQKARGYAAGADFSLSGEFVQGLESAFRISLMKSEEDIKGDSYEIKKSDGALQVIYPGYLKRPTDQRMNLSAFFQDRLFNSPDYKVHLMFLYGSSLPVGPPGAERYQDNFKIPAYKRVDIGFSKNFLRKRTTGAGNSEGGFFKSLIVYAEVFNLLNINNTVSYLWIKDVNNNEFAVPNYLTSRQLNIKIIAKFKN